MFNIEHYTQDPREWARCPYQYNSQWEKSSSGCSPAQTQAHCGDHCARFVVENERIKKLR